MASWRECKLGDLIHIKHGYALLGEHFGDKGSHIVVTPGSFYDAGGFKHKGDKEKWYSGPIPEEYVLKQGDVVIAMTEQAEGLLGSSAIIPKSGLYLHNQRIGLVQILDPQTADSHFLYYLFNTKPVRQHIRGSASGTKIRHTAPSRVAAVPVRIPPLPVQRRIAGILSAYDELIENSQRRIRLLEDMARALYREWFVHFRFPGHDGSSPSGRGKGEGAKPIPRLPSALGDIPQGWEVKKLGDILELNYGKALKKEDRREGEFPVFGSSGQVGTHDTNLVKGPGIIVGRKGNVGSVFWCDEDFFVIDTAYFVTSSLPLRFLFYVLPTLNFINSDAAVPGLSRNQAYTLEVAVPPAALLTKFCELAESFERQASTLQRQIQNLRRTRDLLLPRLLSDKTHVSNSTSKRG